MIDNNYFLVKDTIVDYNYLGFIPERFKDKTTKEILNYFFDVFKYSIKNEVLTLYGTEEDIKNLIIHNKNIECEEFEKSTYDKKWAKLVLVLIDMFFSLQDFDTILDVLPYIQEHIDDFSKETTNTIINDLNFALYFAIEDGLFINPSYILDTGANVENNFILEDLLKKEKEFEQGIRKLLSKKDVDLGIFETQMKELFKKGFEKEIFNSFIMNFVSKIEITYAQVTQTGKEFDDYMDNFLASTEDFLITFYKFFVLNEIKQKELIVYTSDFILDTLCDKLNIE